MDGHTNVAEALLAAGANPNLAATDGSKGRRPREAGRPRLALTCRGWGWARPHTVADTPLHVAAEGGHAMLVESLLASGADPGVRNQAGHLARDRATVAAVQHLLDGRCRALVTRRHLAMR